MRNDIIDIMHTCASTFMNLEFERARNEIQRKSLLLLFQNPIKFHVFNINLIVPADQI